jgi:dephospho-CoA kinase
MSVILGLSGGIGSGKSTVSRMLERLGAVVIDADRIVRELQAPGSPVLDEIVRAFGPGVLDADGALDRDALGAVVFRDPEARSRLNGIVHPRVGIEMVQRAAAARDAGARLVVLDIPLLFEVKRSGTGNAGLYQFDATVVVWAPREVQIRRQMERDGCDREQAERRVSAQMPLDEKKSMADHVIDNSGTLAETERQVRALWRELLGEEPPGAPAC